MKKVSDSDYKAIVRFLREYADAPSNDTGTKERNAKRMAGMLSGKLAKNALKNAIGK